MSGPAYVAGVDGGQSATTAAIATLDGTELARGMGPPADLVGERPGSTRQALAIVTAIRDALARSGLAADTPMAAVAVGLTGYEKGDLAPTLGLPGIRLRVVHDTVTAHAGAFGGEPGIVTIAGTGSVSFGIDAAGTTARTGGWGFLFGDGGSAFAIGRAAIALAMRREDRLLPCDLSAAIFEHFGGISLRAVQSGFAHGAIARPEIAALAVRVAEAADAGSIDAEELLEEGTRALAQDVLGVYLRLTPGRYPVSYAGGLFKSATYLQAFRSAVAACFPLESALVVAPAGDGVAGAVRLAVRLAAGPPERWGRT